MADLSVNVNKFALIRNSRGSDNPNLVEIAKKCIKYGAQGITLHPRPDERHAKFSDLLPMANLTKSYKSIEFNIEGYPSKKFIHKVNKVKPDQVTLVPDPPGALTSSFGWDCKKNKSFLKNIVKSFKKNNIRVSLFINPSKKNLEYLNDINPDRVELYTYDYAKKFNYSPDRAIKKYLEVNNFLKKNFKELQINAGHDLNLKNLNFFLKKISNVKEVSIGHAIVCDTFEYGLKNAIKKYLKITKKFS